MNHTSREILQSYINGKDPDQYLILEKIYDVDAGVVFDMASTTISFPENIYGRKEIARVLSRDFNQKNHMVRTYYLSKQKDSISDISNQKWLVIMRDSTTQKTRVGTGYHDWQFINNDGELFISKHKIYIHCMLEIADDNMADLSRIQKELAYPWTDIKNAYDILAKNTELVEVSSYLK